jgi:hypothetical protein
VLNRKITNTMLRSDKTKLSVEDGEEKRRDEKILARIIEREK